jgi:peroxiredoxin
MLAKALPQESRHDLHSIPAPKLIAALRQLLFGQSGSHILDHALKAGEMAPMFRLPDATGELVTLSTLLLKGPVVLVFFWGDWSPFCNLTEDELAEANAQIGNEGATLIGLSPHSNTNLHLSGRRYLLPFPALDDMHCKVARRYGLTFLIPHENRAAYATLGHPAPAEGPSGDWLLPIPATYVIASTGRIVLSYLDTSCRTRLEPTEIALALRGFRERGARQLTSHSRSK